MGTVLLSEHSNWWCENDIWDEEDGQHQVVLIANETQVLVHSVCFRITQISLVERVEQVHDGEHRQNAKIELET